MLETRGQLKAGDKVLILGASGGVGTCCVQLAKSLGCEVIACASSAWKVAKLKELGADHVIDTSAQNYVAEIHPLYGKPRTHGGGGVDAIVNYTGGETWAECFRALKLQGKLLTCGATANYDPKTDIRYILLFEFNIIGSNGWTPEDIRELLRRVGRRPCQAGRARHVSARRDEDPLQAAHGSGGVRQSGADPMSEITRDGMQAMLDGSPFIRLLRMSVASLDREKLEVAISMPLAPEFERYPGTRQFHGGAIASLIDVSGDFALVLAQVGGGVPTINLRVDYLRPAVGRLLATAKALVPLAERLAWSTSM